MSPEEYYDFLNKLNALKTNQQKLAFAEQFYLNMVLKYRNQFVANGLIDNLTDLINELRKGDDN